MFSILIVDDNLADREGINDLIDWDELGIKVVGLAVDGLDGYNKGVELKPDFVLTDVSMPVMNGIEMTQKIKHILPEVKFVFMSCFDDFEFLQNAINLEVYSYILKPIDLNELTSALIKIRDLRQAELGRENNLRELKLKLKESIPLLQEQFIRDLLYGKLKNENNIDERMKYLGIDFTDKYYTVLFIQIDNYDLLYSDSSIENRLLISYSVKNHVYETLLKEFTGYVTDQQYSDLAIILIPDNKNSEDALNKIIELSNKCKEVVNNNLNLNITIGIGEFSNRLEKLPEIFETAEYAVKSKFFSGGNRVIMGSEVKIPEGDYQYDIAELKNEIYHMLENGEEKDVDAFIRNFYDADKPYTETYIKGLTYSIINIAQTFLFEKNESFASIFDNDAAIWNKLIRFETIVDIKQWVHNILEEIRKYFNRSMNSRYQKIVEDIKLVIDENYESIENVNQIVEPLYISASHANVLFKQCTGQTIFDYLIMKRMETAKNMLMEPYTKIYEIAQRVGYKTNSYFASVFKEYTGLTPKQFRDKYTN